MASRHVGNGDPGLGGLLQDPQLLVDGIPPSALDTRIHLSTRSAIEDIVVLLGLRLAPIYDMPVRSKWGPLSTGIIHAEQ